MKGFHDKAEMRFGALVAIEVERWHVDNRLHSRPATWRCKCDCGQVATVHTFDLTVGLKISCGACAPVEEIHATRD